MRARFGCLTVPEGALQGLTEPPVPSPSRTLGRVVSPRSQAYCPTRSSSSREVRIRYPFFCVVYFSKGSLPKKSWQRGTAGGPSPKNPEITVSLFGVTKSGPRDWASPTNPRFESLKLLTSPTGILKTSEAFCFVMT